MITDLGDDRSDTASAVAYVLRNGRVDVLPRDGAYDVELDPAGWDFRVLAPVLAGEIARAWAPSPGTARIDPSHDAGTGQWELTVDIGPPGWTRVHIRSQD